MRFRVEVTPLDGENAGNDNFSVAEHWQAALSDVRELRGEGGTLDSLSFEALPDDAHRVIDARRMLRYVVEPAPEERDRHPSFVLLAARDVEPSDHAPFTYRERAVRLAEPASRDKARQVLTALFEEVLSELGEGPFGQVVELGAFATDAVTFEAPVATLSFKDWQHELTWWFAETLPETTQASPSPASLEAPARPLLGSVLPRPSTRPPDAAVPSSRRAHADLVAELFDVMHELDFVRDIPSGVAFVQNLLGRLLPGRLSVVHVFDIDADCFVLVGARGLAAGAIGSKLPAADPFFRALLQRNRAQRIEGADLGPSELRGHFASSPPARLMASPATYQGRDLGVLEVGDPEGPEPYSDQEAAALDYIASRFAEFLAQRPIVLDVELFGG